MSSLRPCSFLREKIRNHPVIASTTAATGGVLLGAFVAVQLLATPKPASDVAGTAQAAVEANAAPKPPAETTGSAPKGDSVASADCDQQTWPHLSRACMEEFRNKNRSTRVVSTDKLDKPTIAAIETQPAAPPGSLVPPNSGNSTAPAAVVETPPAVVGSPKPSPATSPLVTTPTPPASTPVPAATPAAAPQPVLLAPATAQAGAVPPPPDVQNGANEKRVAKRSSRKPKRKPKAPAEHNVDDDEPAFASGDSYYGAPDDRISYRRADGRGDRSRRIVERWTERVYDVPDARGGRRQVTVIRRDNGGGLFESLFGN